MADRPYQVLARKWRPQRFEDVVGQPAIVKTLANALEQRRIAHAYCFSGIRGVGKTTLARIFAKGLNCRSADGPTAGPCCECEACVEIEEAHNLDVVEMDAASQTGVDDIRQLNEFARYTPSRDRYRVFIIDEAHMLSAQAFNALLKTLEEPPAHVVFLLATTEPHKILPTVLSRCQHYPLARISQREISERLADIAASEEVEISDDALALVAMSADGSLRDAQSLLDKIIAFAGDEVDDQAVVDLLGMVDRELLFGSTGLIADGDVSGILELVNRMVERGVDLHQFTLDLIGHLRNLLIVSTVPEAASILHLPEADLDQLREQAERFEIDDLDRAFSLLSSSEYRIKQSEVPRYHLEVVLARLARMPHLQPIAELLSRFDGGGSGGGTDTGGERKGSGGRRAGGAGAGVPGRARSAAGLGGQAPQPAATAPSRRSERPGPPRPGGAKTAPAGTQEVSSTRPAGASTPQGRPEPPRPAPAGPGPPDGATVGRRPARQADPETSPPTTAGDGAGGTLIAELLAQLRSRKPVIARLVDRALDVELNGDVLRLSFPDQRIVRARLEERSALDEIEVAAEAVVGRSIRVLTTFDDEAPRNGSAAAPASPHGGPRRTSRNGPADARSDELWQRAENEPMVKRFVDALQGQLVDVDEV